MSDEETSQALTHTDQIDARKRYEVQIKYAVTAQRV